MTETLYIRLGSQAEDKIHWLIEADETKEIIASGELLGAGQLNQLTEKAAQREVVVFVPGCDVALKSLNVPSSSERATKLAVPYMLEDELAQDVEQLFFAYSNIKKDDKGNNCFVVAVEHQQMELWQSWLANAELTCKKMMVDLLAMPEVEDGWTAIALGDQILLRQSSWQGFVVDRDAWAVIKQQWQTPASKNTENDEDSGELDEIPVIHCYSSLNFDQVDAEESLNVNVLPEELPLALLAHHSRNQAFNLLQGEHKSVRQHSPALVNWFWAAGIAIFAIILNFGVNGVQLLQLSAQQEAVEKEIISVYKKTFPNSKRVRVSTIRSQLKQKIGELGSGDNSVGFLMMLEKIQPAFAKVPQLKPQSIKFDGKRQEIRMQAVAKDYQHFEQFKNALEKAQLTVSQGAQNNQGDEVTGSFSISSNKKRKK
ncbi:MAG: type II secretion system protein GspL [Alteromonadaceae bacterium]|nr:type II secretion system protein GspL [Alteromonadaceae bacterium]